MRLSKKDLALLQGKSKPKKSSKYRNQPTEVDGLRFDSKAEAAYYGHLKLLKAAGDVIYFLRQVPFDLPGNVKYRCDFMVVRETGIEYIDVKGAITATFRLKKKQVEALYPVKIRCVKHQRGQFSYIEE